MALTQSILERNEQIIRSHLYDQMKASLDVGADLIDEEMKGSSVILKPLVKSVYNALVKNQLEVGTKRTINGTLKMSRNLVLDNVELDSPEFYNRLNEKFPGYLKNDQTGRQCRKSHRNFPKLATNLKTTFEWQLKPVVNLLKVEDDNIRDYGDLCRAAYKREELKNALKNQTDAMDFGLQVIEEDKSILDIPAAKDLILRVLRKGFDKKVDDFQKEIDDFYSS